MTQSTHKNLGSDCKQTNENSQKSQRSSGRAPSKHSNFSSWTPSKFKTEQMDHPSWGSILTPLRDRYWLPIPLCVDLIFCLHPWLDAKRLFSKSFCWINAILYRSPWALEFTTPCNTLSIDWCSTLHRWSVSIPKGTPKAVSIPMTLFSICVESGSSVVSEFLCVVLTISIYGLKQ